MRNDADGAAAALFSCGYASCVAGHRLRRLRRAVLHPRRCERGAGSVPDFFCDERAVELI